MCVCVHVKNIEYYYYFFDMYDDGTRNRFIVVVDDGETYYCPIDNKESDQFSQ